MIRSVGYCDNMGCDAFHKGVFLLNHGDKFFCPRCRQLGWIEVEKRAWRNLEGVKETQAVYREARVIFGYLPSTRTYEYTAIVAIPELNHGAIFEITSPLIRTEKRALKIAEYALCTANSGRVDASGFSTELRIDFGSPEWKAQIEHAGVVLGERDRRLYCAIRQDA